MKIINTLLATLFSLLTFGQDSYRVDGIAGAVGNEVILISSINEELNGYAAQGSKIDQCQLFTQMMMQKLIMHKAKQDSTIVIDYSQINNQVDYALGRMKAQFGSMEAVEQAYKLTEKEIKEELINNYKDQSYAQQQQQRIVSGLDISPREVKSFFNKNRYQFPKVGEEVELKQIVIYPKIKDKNKEVLINKLKEIKKLVLEGESFATQAILNSQDEGSAANGGAIENVRRGQMVTQFEAVAYNMEEGEISEPFETEFGFHIIKLLKRKGEILDLRHILLKPEPTTEEIKEARIEMDSIRAKIIRKELSFKEAVKKYSEDKHTRFSGGTLSDPKTKYTRIEKNNLDINTTIEIVGLDINDITKPFEDEIDNKQQIRMIKVANKIEAHHVDYSLDYEKLKGFAIQQKQNQEIEKWAKGAIKDTYIKVDSKYQSCNKDIDWTKK